MAQKTARPTLVTSGFCNPYDKAINQAHERCEVECSCPCHQRFALVWLDWMGEAQTQEGFRDEDDAKLVLAMLQRLEMIPADSETDVIPYVGEVPW